MSTPRERRPLNPSARLTSTSNAAQPVLSSHRESVAQAQRARAIAEAQNAPTDPTLRPTPPTLTIIPPDLTNNHSSPGSLPITPATSQTGSIPPSTAPPSESDQNAEPALKKGVNNRKRQRKNSRRISKLRLISIFFNILLSGAGDTAQTDEHGMYRDVSVMDIDSDSESPDPAKKNKNKNPKADIDHFFEPIKRLNGDKCGRRRCKSCM